MANKLDIANNSVCTLNSHVGCSPFLDLCVYNMSNVLHDTLSVIQGYFRSTADRIGTRHQSLRITFHEQTTLKSLDESSASAYTTCPPLVGSFSPVLTMYQYHIQFTGDFSLAQYVAQMEKLDLEMLA